MAFMMPVVKKDWEIYPNKPVRSRKTSTCSNPRNKSSPDMLSVSPRSPTEFIPPSVTAYQRAESPEETVDVNTDAMPTLAKSASTTSFSNFHVRLVERIRKISRSSKNCEVEGESGADAAGRSPT